MKKIAFPLVIFLIAFIAVFLFKDRTVTIGTPYRGPIVQGVYGTGSVEADEEISLSFQLSGRLKSLFVEEGQGVKAGQLLAELDIDDEVASIENLRSAEENTLEIYKRKKILFSQKNTSLEQLQDAQTSYEQAHFQRIQAQATLEKSQMRAPIDGVIVRKDMQVGAVLQSDEVFLWLSPEKRRITADVDEEYFPLLREGQIAQCQAPAFPDKVFAGKIYQITPKGDRTTRTYRIRLRPIAPYPSLSLGMTVETNVIVREDKHALLVPHQAYTSGSVWIVKDQHLTKRLVTIGVQNDTAVEILKGLSPYDKIVLSPRENMQEGQWVWPINP